MLKELARRLQASVSNTTRVRAPPNFFPQIGVVFVHIPKTAGSSLHAYFAELSALRTGSPRLPELQAFGTANWYKHRKAGELRDWIGHELWQRSTTVTFVRNPWDLMVSSYGWWLQKAHQYKRFRSQAAQVHALGSFDRFIASEFGSRMINEAFGAMEDWFQEAGADIVQHIGKVETIERDLAVLIDALDLPGTPRPMLGRCNASVRQAYRTYYTAESKRQVAQRFEYVIDRFAYTF